MHAGWGLDWLWPFLLGYPPKQVAFIDEVCVIHPKKTLQDPDKVSMYSILKRPHGEEYEQYSRYVFASPTGPPRLFNSRSLENWFTV